MIKRLFGRKKKQKHEDEVQAFKYNGSLYPSLHAMNAQKERDVKSKLKEHIKSVLYYLSINKYNYERLGDFEKHIASVEIERNYVFRGEYDIHKLTDILIEHWPYIANEMSKYQNAKKDRESEEHV